MATAIHSSPVSKTALAKRCVVNAQMGFQAPVPMAVAKSMNAKKTAIIVMKTPFAKTTLGASLVPASRAIEVMELNAKTSTNAKKIPMIVVMKTPAPMSPVALAAALVQKAWS